MKNLFTFFVFTVIIFLSVSQLNAQVLGEGGWRPGEKQIKILIENPEQVKQLYSLKLNMDFHGPSYHHITAYVIPEELKQIENLGIP